MLSRRIYELREKSGLSGEELAQQLGIPCELLRRWESGEALPTKEHLAALCQCLHATPKELTETHLPLRTPEERRKRREEQRAMERRSGLTLCFAGGVCFILLLMLFVLPEAGQHLRLSTAAVDGAELLFLVSLLAIVTGLLIVIRNQ